MAIFSLTQTPLGLQTVEVEVQFVRGLPSLQILGRPDAAIKECALKLKTAFQNMGWEWPHTQQIVVNLKPAHLRKESSGLDLAIALGIREKQGAYPQSKEGSVLAYGEVDLQGNVSAPKELQFWDKDTPYPLLTGVSEQDFHFDIYQASHLSEVEEPALKCAKEFHSWLKVPKLKDFFFSKKAARLLEITASGEHSVLLAGAAGSGKSTWAEALWSMMPPPEAKEFLKSRLFYLRHNKELKWRPFLQPHHSASTISMVGGGVPPRPGAFSMAHGGVLLMDEYLEFTKDIQEALREPMEKGQIHLFRKTDMVTYPSRFQLIATTNLCPCGDFEPNKITPCNFSLRRCRSHIERLSGPVVDRFDILSFTSGWKQKEVRSEEIKIRIDAAYSFRQKRGQAYSNALLSLNQLMESLTPALVQLLPEEGASQRRKRALLRVARSLADLDQSEKIGREHIKEAMEWTSIPFYQLKQC